jgi:hypothetical protein
MLRDTLNSLIHLYYLVNFIFNCEKYLALSAIYIALVERYLLDYYVIIPVILILPTYYMVSSTFVMNLIIDKILLNIAISVLGNLPIIF